VLQLNPGAQRADVVAKMQRPGRAVAGQDGVTVCVSHELEPQNIDDTSLERAETKMPPGLAASRLRFAWDTREKTGRRIQARHQPCKFSEFGFVFMWASIAQ
jgi:hypothetical protein